MCCVASAWENHSAELRRFLRRLTGDDAAADDLLQELFLRVLRQTDGLSKIDNPRAWLFRAARNLLIDRLRLAKEHVPLPDDLAVAADDPLPPVDALAQCLPRVLAELSAQDREAITLCDIDGMFQHAYAAHLGLSLPAAKARVQRARQRLRRRLMEACQVRFDATGRVCCFVRRSPQ